MIYLVEANAPLSREIELALCEPNLSACTSGAVRMECAVGPLRRQDGALLAAYREFLDALESLPIPDAAWETAATYRAKYNLLLPDALHLAVAEINGCDEFWTADSHFQRMLGQVQTRIRIIG